MVAEMQSRNSAKIDRDRIVTQLVNFASALPQRCLENLQDMSLPAELQSNATTIRMNRNLFDGHQSRELDRLGSEIWNIAIRLNRDSSHAKSRKTITLLRGFAFHLLDSVQPPAQCSFKVTVRLLKTAIKAAQYSLEDEDLESCQKIMERAAVHEETLSKQNIENCNDDTGLRHRLTSEYWGVRMALSWKQDRLDMADVMYSKATSSELTRDLHASESLADLVFQIGKDLLQKKQYHSAVKWLDRSYEALNMENLSGLSFDGEELRLSILHNRVRANLGLEDGAGLLEARGLLSILENVDFNDRIVVSVLKLDLLLAKPPIDTEQLFTVLSRLTRTVNITPTNFKLLMHYIHLLKEHNSEAACKVLDDFLVLRLYEFDNLDYIEKTFITRIWISTSLAQDQTSFESLETLLQGLSAHSAIVLSSSAIHAAHALLWKQIEAEAAQKNYANTELWCRIALHSTLAEAGELNKAKISRKLLLSYVMRDDTVSARKLYGTFPDSTKLSPITQFLMYKVALKDMDEELAAKCLENVCRDFSGNSSFLYACVLEAQNLGNKRQTVMALQKILNNHSVNSDNGVHLPALIRCILRLLITEIPEDHSCTSERILDICNVFETAVAYISNENRSNTRESNFNDDELEWLSMNSYNIILKLYEEIISTSTLRLLDCCLYLIELIMTKNVVKSPDLSKRAMVCNCLAAQLLLDQARAEKKESEKRHFYLQLRKHVSLFQSAFSTAPKHNSTAAHFERMLSRLLRQDFEAAIQIGAWSDLTKIIEDSKVLADAPILEVLADMTLASDAPPGVIISTLETLLEALHSSGPNPTNQARWLHCLYQISLTLPESTASSPSSPATTKTDVILSRALSLANATTYPPVELEYLATHTFNRAIDAYCVHNAARARICMEQAVALAGRIEDGGTLRRFLEERWGGLRWDG